MFVVWGVVLVLGLATGKRDPAVQANVDPRTGSLHGMSVRLVLDPLVRQMVTTPLPDIANISLSPWTYRESSVASRVPRVLSNAHCLTSGCLSHPGGEEDAALRVKPIKYQVLVLHRVPSQRQNNNSRKKKRRRRNKYEFRLETEVITVGCTCVRSIV